MGFYEHIRPRDSRLAFIGAVILLGMGLLMSGLWYLQVFASREFVASQQNQSVRTVRVPAVRGKILDRHGRVLAEDRPAYTINAYLEELRPHFRAAWRTARKRVIGGLTRDESLDLQIQIRHQVINGYIDQMNIGLPMTLSPKSVQEHFNAQLALPLPVLKGLNETNVANFMENSGSIPGFDLDVHPTRYYSGIAAAHLLGHLKRNDNAGEDTTEHHYRLPDYAGVLGLERLHDQELRGQAGTKSMLVNNLGYRQGENLLVPAQPGHNLILTLDLAIQEAAVQALRETEREGAAAVVMNPNNGDILALASLPLFDPNQFIPRLTPETWRTYNDRQRKPMRFRATQERYPPGSIFKIISGLAALEDGINPAENVYNPGYYRLGRKRIRDTAAPGEYDFREAFKRSSNTYFIHWGMKMGARKIVAMGDQFLLGKRTDLLPGQEAAGQFPQLRMRGRQLYDGDARWYDGDTANISIGQGRISVTPLQMAIMTSAVANGGTVYRPRLVNRVEPADPAAADRIRRFAAGQVAGRLKVQAKNLAIVREAMWADVQESTGTGKRAAIDGFDICGKTGTAEVQLRGGGRGKVTWFVAFAPLEHPRYAVVVMTEKGASGGLTCAPAAKKIFQALLKQEGETPAPGDGIAQVD